jgi:tRNA nucleotidyltransferase (CCA-adding enzyme)
MSFPDRLPIPDEVLSIARKLEGAGFETWCVGGAVRDNLLGYENKDFDLATIATPQQVRKLFRNTIPVGIEHGTVAVLDRHKQPHEVTTFRRDIKTDGRHAVVEFGVDLQEDLARRDFTINAIAYHPLRHEWRDPFGGQADLERKLIRAVGDPELRFREDYLRILRALRFAARFGFEIDPATWEAARANVRGLENLSAERVRDEWMNGLTAAQQPSRLVELWCDVGAMELWLPEVRCALSAGPDGAAILDRFGGSDPVLITAYLSSNPEATLRRLKCSNAEVERGARIGLHRGAEPEGSSEVAVRRWLSQVEPAADDLVAIAVAEGRGGALQAAVRQVRATNPALAVTDLAINGNDLKDLGIPEGRAIGEILRLLLERVIEDPALNTRERLRALASELAKQHTAPSAQRTTFTFPVSRPYEHLRNPLRHSA